MVRTPQRIVSLLPSATEIVCALGLGDALVGVSHECDWPPFVRALPVLTSAAIPADLPSGETDRLVRERLARGEGLYMLDAAVLRDLQPTLIVTQALCEVCSIALPEVLRVARSLPEEPPVLSLEPHAMADIWADIAPGCGGGGRSGAGRVASWTRWRRDLPPCSGRWQGERDRASHSSNGSIRPSSRATGGRR